MGPRLPLSRRPQDDGEPQFSLCQAGRAAAGPRRVPSLAKGARSSEPRAFLPPGLLLRLPTATSSVSRRPLRAALSARRVGAQPRRADLASDPAQRGESGSGVADPEPERGGEGGRGREGRSVAGRRAVRTAASPRPSPPGAPPAPPPPGAPAHPRGVAGRNHSRSAWSAAPPRARLGWGALPPKLSLASFQPPSREAAAHPRTPRVPRPSPQTPARTSLLGFGRRDAPLFVPGPGHGGWTGAGSPGEGRSAARGRGPGRATAAPPGVCSARARSERRAPGEQVLAARRAHGRAREQRP